MLSFITFDPKLPPIIRIISLLFLTNCKLSLNVTHNLSQNGDANLLASPGVISDSCAITGIFFIEAAITTGTVTNPPFENITSGFSFDNIFLAS